MIPSTPSFLKRVSVTNSWSNLILSLCLLLMKLKDKGITLETPGKLSTGVSEQGAAIPGPWAFLYNAQRFLSGGFSWILRVFSFWSWGSRAQLLVSVIPGNEVLGKNPIQQLPPLTSALQADCRRGACRAQAGSAGKGRGGLAWLFQKQWAGNCDSPWALFLFFKSTLKNVVSPKGALLCNFFFFFFRSSSKTH